MPFPDVASKPPVQPAGGATSSGFDLEESFDSLLQPVLDVASDIADSGTGFGLAGAVLGLACFRTPTQLPKCIAAGAAAATALGESISQYRETGKVDPGSVAADTLINAAGAGTAKLALNAAKAVGQKVLLRAAAWVGTMAGVGNGGDAAITYTLTGDGEKAMNRLSDGYALAGRVGSGVLLYGLTRFVLSPLAGFAGKTFGVKGSNPSLDETQILKATLQRRAQLDADTKVLAPRTRKQVQEMSLVKPNAVTGLRARVEQRELRLEKRVEMGQKAIDPAALAATLTPEQLAAERVNALLRKEAASSGGSISENSHQVIQALRREVQDDPLAVKLYHDMMRDSGKTPTIWPK